MLHCKHLNERLEFGMESVAILSHSFINNGGKIIACRSAMVDLGLNQVDPGLSPDGAKCAPGKVIYFLAIKFYSENELIRKCFFFFFNRCA